MYKYIHLYITKEFLNSYINWFFKVLHTFNKNKFVYTWKF